MPEANGSSTNGSCSDEVAKSCQEMQGAAELCKDPPELPGVISEQAITVDNNLASDQAEYPYLPNSLPYQFRLDVVGIYLKDASSNVQDHDLRRLPKTLKKQWREARIQQELAWASAGRVPIEVEDAVHANGGSVRALRETVKDWGDPNGNAWKQRKMMLKKCVHVIGIHSGTDKPISAEDFNSGVRHLYLIVDVSTDPLLGDLGYSGDTKFKLLLVVYDQYLNDGRSREVRFARVTTFEFALLCPNRPYPGCSLQPPPADTDIGAKFPLDSDIDAANYHQETIMAAKATLACLFWDCFDIICTKIFTLNAEACEQVKQDGRLEKLKNVRERFRRSTGCKKLRDCLNRAEALETLWDHVNPSAFDFTFRQTLTAEEVAGCDGQLLNAVTLAMHKAALELEQDQTALLPPEWAKAKHDANEFRWPLYPSKQNTSQTTDELPSQTKGEEMIIPVEPLVPVSCELAFVEFEVALFEGSEDPPKTESKDEDNEEEISVDKKIVNVVINFSQWQEKGELTVMDLKTDDVWGISEVLEIVSEFEECAQDISDDLTNMVAQLAYGLRALQRAQLKQTLRDVGLVVFESARAICEEEGIVEQAKLRRALGLQELKCRWKGTYDSLTEQLQGHVQNTMQRFMVVSAPNGVLDRCAEAKKMLATLLPDGTSGKYAGGFEAEQFIRGGPQQEFWVSTLVDPYPYQPYFAASLPSVDPTTVWSPAERKFIIRGIITGPPSEIRLPDGRIDPRQGGADIPPRELISKNIVEKVIPLGNKSYEDTLFVNWVTPWKRMGWGKFLKKGAGLFQTQPKSVLSTFGPQIASFFNFMEFHTRGLILPALLGLIAQLMIVDTYYSLDVPQWQHCVAPAFGFLMVFWGGAFCFSWCRRVSHLIYLWDNGIVEAGSEMNRSVTQRHQEVRPEFSTRFRMDFDNGTQEFQEKKLAAIRGALRLDKVPSAAASFSDKILARDIGSFVETCYMTPWERVTRKIFANSITMLFVGLATLVTTFSMYIQFQLANEDSREAKYKSYLVSALVSGCLIPALDNGHKHFAYTTTDWESLRHDLEHDASLFWKLFLFCLFNRFNSLFYIAFIRRDIEQLRVFLMVFMSSQWISGNITEVTLPSIRRHIEYLWQLAAGGIILVHKKGKRFGLLQDFTVEYPGTAQIGILGKVVREVSDQVVRTEDFVLIDELLQVVTIFGIVVLFSAALPAIPLLAMVASQLETRLDAFKLLRLCRQPEIRMTVGIGTPYMAMKCLTGAAMFVTFGIVTVTGYCSDQDCNDVLTLAEAMLPDESYSKYERMQYMVITEHILVGLLILASWLGSSGTFSKDIVDEMYRQSYFDNREALAYRESTEFNASVSAVLRSRGSAGNLRNVAACQDNNVSDVQYTNLSNGSKPTLG